MLALASICTTAFTITSLAPSGAARAVVNMKAQIAEGEVIPSVVFKTRVRTDEAGDNPFDWKDMTSEDYFKGKRVAIFSLPGAFTPTCSSTHLPGYQKAFSEMKELGVDAVYCLSVNDAFVMRKWGLDQGMIDDKEKKFTPDYWNDVQLIPDGACQFTRGMGMTCTWEKERGFGERSWRYSAVFDDMKVEKLFVEPGRVEDSGPDPFEVSDADTMLEYLRSVKK